MSELAIQYFVAVIISEFLGYRGAPRNCQTLIPSFLAASCAATLYDEIYCRDESLLLLHTHGFFCLVLALPLVHSTPLSSSKEESRKRDLGVLRSILTEMCDRYGDGKMALRMIDDLENKVERTVRRQTEPELGNSMEELECDNLEPEMDFDIHDVQRLFPFPPSLCDNMDLLELLAAPNDQLIANHFDPAQTWPGDHTTFDLTWMDLFELDFGDSNTIEGDS
jgi:hypothetical protein